MTSLENQAAVCLCGHCEYLHKPNHSCGRFCRCKKYVPDPRRTANLSVTLSADLLYRFKNQVMLRHGLRKGGLSLEVERALRKYLGEYVTELMTNKEWQENNR